MMNQHASFLPPFVPTRRSVRLVGILFMLSAAISWVAVGYDFSEIRLGPEVEMKAGLIQTIGARISAGALKVGAGPSSDDG